MAQVALVGVAAVAVVLAGVLVVLGDQALGPGSYTVSGTVVESGAGPGIGLTVPATVVLTADNGQKVVEQTGSGGGFSFTNVPAGGISLNITAPSFAPVTVLTFASPVYNAGTTGLSVTLVYGGPANATTTTLSQFPDLESFLASIGSGVVLLGIVAVFGGVAAAVTRRSDRPAVGVVGGAAGALAPAALYFLALGGLFPVVTAGTAVLAGLGAFAATTRTVEIFQVGPESRTS
jgi:hypothetical protein